MHNMEIPVLLENYLQKGNPFELTPVSLSRCMEEISKLEPERFGKKRKLLDLASLILWTTSIDCVEKVIFLPLGGGKKMSGLVEFTAGSTSKEHSHDHIELLYVVMGTLRLRIADEIIYLQEDTFCLIDANVRHCEFYDPVESLIVCLGIDDVFFVKETALQNNEKHNTTLKSLINRKRSQYSYILFTPKEPVKTESTITLERITEEFMDTLPNRQHLIIDYIERLLLLLPREYQLQIQKPDREEFHRAVIGDILEYIKANSAAVTVKDIAKIYHYHPDYLNRLFTQLTGDTISRHIQRIRMHQAMDLLIQTDLPVDMISRKTGYQNVSFFYRKFNAEYKCTPDAARKKYRQQAPPSAENLPPAY